MIRIRNYNNIIDIDIEIEEPIETKKITYYLDPIIGKRTIDYEYSTLLNFIFFLQNNQDATKQVPIELYNELIGAIRQEDKKLKKKFLKTPSPYVQAFFNHNNHYITSFYDCINKIKKGVICI